MSYTTASSWCSIPGTICPSTGRSAASTGCGSPIILPRGRYGGNRTWWVMSSQPKPDRSGGLQRTQTLPNVENEALHAERRQLTVAFIDIVGSTPLSERIDPEEFFAVIRTYRDICDEQIRHYGGHIARMIGDGLLAFLASRKPMKMILNARSAPLWRL